MLPDLHTGYQTMKSCTATTAGRNSVSNSPSTTVGPVARDSVTNAHMTAERFPLVDGITQSEFALTAIKSLVTFNPRLFSRSLQFLMFSGLQMKISGLPFTL